MFPIPLSRMRPLFFILFAGLMVGCAHSEKLADPIPYGRIDGSKAEETAIYAARKKGWKGEIRAQAFRNCIPSAKPRSKKVEVADRAWRVLVDQQDGRRVAIALISEFGEILDFKVDRK